MVDTTLDAETQGPSAGISAGHYSFEQFEHLKAAGAAVQRIRLACISDIPLQDIADMSVTALEALRRMAETMDAGAGKLVDNDQGGVE